ncbi:hypothetical protein NLJ89_g10134 [Agrocybe chaxingu]|uniref:Uncharacterized protein n=1 Tax=Agrocybe chaxingu TaxID=84603 RepID=A0A9W8MQK2_9AGAR|nr:hypothetical protein NLJ89_g10134 [Agrocybe chaxingu]
MIIGGQHELLIVQVSLSTNPKLSTSFSPCKLHEVESWQAEAYFPPPHSIGHQSVKTAASTASSWGSGHQTRNVARDEPCFVTKDLAYVLQRAHWVNAVRRDADRKAHIVTLPSERFLSERGIVSLGFNLDEPSNLTNLSSMLHIAMDKFDMFAVTCSEPSLDALITLVQRENDKWQDHFNFAEQYSRTFQFRYPPFTDCQYDLVVLHRKHFLPKRRCLTSYASGNPVLYAMADDGVLRHYPALNTSPRFPSFRFDATRSPGFSLNPFLVVLAAEIKFRRFLRWRATLSSPHPLDPLDKTLIEKTITLAELLYFQPVAALGSVYRHRMDAWMDVDSEGSGKDGSSSQPSEFGEMEQGDAMADSTARPLGAQRIHRRADLDAQKSADFYRDLLFSRETELTPEEEQIRREILASEECPEDLAEKIQTWRQYVEV